MEMRNNSTFNGMVMLYLDTFCPTKLLVEIDILETDVVSP